jgi:hypothetical protein
MQFNRIGNFGDRKRHNEIDIIAINDTKNVALFVDVKLQHKNYDEQARLEKVSYASAKLKLKGYSLEHRGVSLDTLEEFIANFPEAT